MFTDNCDIVPDETFYKGSMKMYCHKRRFFSREVKFVINVRTEEYSIPVKYVCIEKDDNTIFGENFRFEAVYLGFPKFLRFTCTATLPKKIAKSFINMIFVQVKCFVSDDILKIVF